MGFIWFFEEIYLLGIFVEEFILILLGIYKQSYLILSEIGSCYRNFMN